MAELSDLIHFTPLTSIENRHGASSEDTARHLWSSCMELQSRAWFCALHTIDILGQIIRCCEGCPLIVTEPHPWPLPARCQQHPSPQL